MRRINAKNFWEHHTGTHLKISSGCKRLKWIASASCTNLKSQKKFKKWRLLYIISSAHSIEMEAGARWKKFS